MSDDIHPLRRQIDDLEFDGDTQTARRLSEEARETIDNQLDTLDDIDAKAMSILRLNVLLVGVILTAVSVAVEIDAVVLGELNNGYVAIGVGSLVLSTALAAITYTSSDSEVGIDGESIRAAVDASLDEEEFEAATAQSYAAWIEFNDRTNVMNAPVITLTMLLVVIGLVHLAIGVYAAVGGSNTNLVAVVSWVLMGPVVSASNVFRQLSRAIDELSLDDLRP